MKAPLDDTDPAPLEIEMDPLVEDELCPADRTMRPPAPDTPLPTAMLILPPTPLPVDAPVSKAIEPLLPDEAEPDR